MSMTVVVPAELKSQDLAAKDSNICHKLLLNFLPPPAGHLPGHHKRCKDSSHCHLLLTRGLLDNLLLIRLHCVPLQFMPQDKVASFAALSPTDLLLVTQKSIGTQELLQLHRQLIDNRRKEKDERKASMRGFSALLLIDSCWHAQHRAPCQPALCCVRQLASQQGLH